jgi:hypothetical protein
VLVIWTGVLLSGCASLGDGKNAGSETESQGQTDNPGTPLETTSGNNPETRTEPVVNTGGSGEQQPVQAANLNANKDMFKYNAMYLKQALDRILPTTLSEMNWDRITTVLAGLLVISMIYGLAFGLGRLPLRRRGADPREGGR